MGTPIVTEERKPTRKTNQNFSFGVSTKAKHTTNPIRNIVDVMKLEPNSQKPVISLALGDPCAYGNLDTPPQVTLAVINELQNSIKSCNGYAPQIGQLQARQAVADYLNVQYSYAPRPIQATDVVITSGCSGALQMAMELLLNPGERLLLPCPGFSLYKTITDSLGLESAFYPLLDDRNWEIDLDKVEQLIIEDPSIRAWLINNPSNPCGSVFSREHLHKCLLLAHKHNLIIIADEIYEGMTFDSVVCPFIPLGSLLMELSLGIPILTCGGIAKRFCVPGWRLGWIIIHEPNLRDNKNIEKIENVGKLMDDIRQGLVDLAGLILGANTIVQTALPKILNAPIDEWKSNVMNHLQSNANLVIQRLRNVPNLQAIAPQGAMYMMIFGAPEYIRIVLCPPKDMMAEALDRLVAFCQRHHLQQ